MSVTQEVIENLARHVQDSIASIGKTLGEQQEEDFEAAIDLLHELNQLRGHVLKLRERFVPAPAPSLDPLQQEPVVLPPFEPIPIEEPVAEQQNFEDRRPLNGKPPEGEYTPVQDYKPFMLRVMYRQRGSQRAADIQKSILKLMKQEGLVKPLDEQPVGPSGVIRYVAQAAAVRRQLMKQGLIAGAGSEGFRLTPEGKKLAEELLPDLKSKKPIDAAETDKP